MPKVKHDIIGPCSQELYAIAGTEVEIISDRGNVMIVKDANDKRFPVPTECLTEDPASVIPIKRTIEKPGTARNHKKKAAPVTQQNLF